ncbi:MAG TPA: TolC family protein, partial [Pyrinomonadaceae bacterium]|nr:TolC family protein [Pyrinomonadaceae bacterium]
MKRSITVLLIVCLAQTFVLGQKKTYQPPQVQIPANLDRKVTTPQTDPQTVADLKWFDVFQDDKLQAMVREALTYNYDLRTAVTRVDAARASLGIVRSDQYPQIGATASYTAEGLSREIRENGNHFRSFGDILLNLFTFELDFFGRKRKATRAAKADLLASEEAQRAVITGIISEVATSYYNLRELDFQLEIAKRTLSSRQESLRIIKLRQERGVSNLLELRQAEELVYNATEVIPAVEQSIGQQENFISVLIGKNP